MHVHITSFTTPYTQQVPSSFLYDILHYISVSRYTPPQHSLFLLKAPSNSEGLFTIEVPYPSTRTTQEVSPIRNSSTLAKSTAPQKGNECSVRLKALSAGTAQVTNVLLCQ